MPLRYTDLRASRIVRVESACSARAAAVFDSSRTSARYEMLQRVRSDRAIRQRR